MQRSPRGLWTLGGSDEIRLREREGLFVAIRWLVAAFAIAAVAADDGRWAVVAWSIPVLLGAVNVVASVGRSRLRRVVHLRILGVAVNTGDGAIATAAMFNYAHQPDTATGLLLMLVVLEAAVRWGRIGGWLGGGLAGGISLGWMAHRDAEFAVELELSTALGRVGAYLVAGLLLGTMIRELERAGREVRRGLRRTDAIGRFALEAPRLSVEQAAERVARILHDDLDFERAAVVLAPERDPDVFRLAATSGYDPADVDGYRQFPVSVGVVGRCFRTGEAQFLEDVSDDPDYLAVDADTRSEMAVPLRSGDRVFGVIDVASTTVGAFASEDLRFLETVAAQLGRAFDNALLAEMERATIHELEELSAMKDDFIAIANHELRTPVTSIAGFAQSLLRQKDVMSPEEIDDAIRRIARQSSHLRHLLEDLLTLPRAEGGRRRLGRVPVALEDVAREVVRGFEAPGDAHRIEVESAGELPMVDADPDAVRRVFVNLLSNAVKYSPKGGLVSVRMSADGPFVRAEVEDQGVGIAPEDVPSLFRKFGRLSLGDDGRGGMGVGLFIVKELVEEMGGSVGVESSPGQGSCFWFRLRQSQPLPDAVSHVP